MRCRRVQGCGFSYDVDDLPDGSGPVRECAPASDWFLDPTAFRGPSADRSVLRAQRAGATLVRVLVAWKGVAPARPADLEDPAYHWHFIDQQVVDAVRGGLDPLVYISASAPWASGAAVGLPGTWPAPARFADFARATALALQRHVYTDRSHGPAPAGSLLAGLERAERRTRARAATRGGRAVSPTQYRRMVNAFADAVHGVDARNLVVAGGLGPFGHDSKDIQVVAPMEFMGTLLCVSLRAPHRKTCSERTRFDVWAHHPYSNGGPNWHAHGVNNASIGDLPEMRALLAAAERAGTITSARVPEFWVTEFSWDSSPPDPQGVPSPLHARWVAEALYRMWQAGVSAVIWFRLRTTFFASRPTSPASSRRTDRPSTPRGVPIPLRGLPCGSAVTVWGRTPFGKSGSVIVERQSGKRWISVARVRADRHGIFSQPLSAQATSALRARLVSPRRRPSRSR